MSELTGDNIKSILIFVGDVNLLYKAGLVSRLSNTILSDESFWRRYFQYNCTDFDAVTGRQHSFLRFSQSVLPHPTAKVPTSANQKT